MNNNNKINRKNNQIFGVLERKESNINKMLNSKKIE